MERPLQQEKFSEAFLHAIAAGAGCASSKPFPDHDSIDWTLSCRLPRRPKIDIQLKSTAVPKVSQECIRYRLKAKNFRELSLTDLAVPRLLVLIVVPSDVEDWLCFSPERLILRQCAYWLSLAGTGRIGENKAVTVKIPGNNLFTSEVLRNLMHTVNNGEPL